MANTEMDDFNEKEIKITTKNTSIAWDEDKETQEASCAVCDIYFEAPVNRPPIFCPACKAGLKHLIAR